MNENHEPALKQPLSDAEITTLLDRAKQGDVECVEDLRRLLQDVPDIWKKYGNLHSEVTQGWLTLSAEKNLLKYESVNQVLSTIRDKFKGSGTTIELILADQLTILWLKAQYFESLHATAFLKGRSEGGTLNIEAARFFEKCLQNTQRQFAQLAKSLLSITSMMATIECKQAKKEHAEVSKRKVHVKRTMPRRIFNRLYPIDEAVLQQGKDDVKSRSHVAAGSN